MRQLLAPPAVRRTAFPSAGVRCRGLVGGADVVHVDVVVRAVHHLVPAVDAVLVGRGQVAPLLGPGAGQRVHAEAVQRRVRGARRRRPRSAPCPLSRAAPASVVAFGCSALCGRQNEKVG